MNILFVLTSHDRLGTTGERTGFWLEEFAAPYYAFLDAGASITLSSPKGAQPPVDPKSALPENQTEATRRLEADATAQAQLAVTRKLVDLSATAFDAIFFPGGHGPMWDLVVDTTSIALIESFAKAGKPVAAVCHAPVALINARGPDDKFLVSGKRVTGFSNEEEQAIGLDSVVPFLLEDRIRERGGLYRRGPLWAPHVEVDGKLVTGQNPASSVPVARSLLDLLRV